MMMMAPTASPAMSRPDVPLVESAAGLALGDGAALVGAGDALDGAAVVGAADVGAGVEVVGAGAS